MAAPSEAGRLIERAAAHVVEPDHHLRFTVAKNAECDGALFVGLGS